MVNMIKTGAHKCPNVKGKMQAIYTDDVVISALKEIGEATPSDVAKKIGCNPVIARNKLKVLAESGAIHGKNIAGRWIFWV